VAFELARIDRLIRTIDLAEKFPGRTPITAAQVALLAPRSAPNAATVWYTASVASNVATVLFAGPDADPSGAVVVEGSADLWVKITASAEVDAAKVERITVLGGGFVPVVPNDRGLPSGGTTGQVLTKASGTAYDVEWDDPTGGGGGGAVASVNGQTGAVVLGAADVGADAAGAATAAQAAATLYASTGLASKVDTSTYTTGLAAKQDKATLGADVAADATVKAAAVGAVAVADIAFTGALNFAGATVTGLTELAPSGGDDTAAVVAQIATYGRVRLGPGVFKWNTAAVVRAKTAYRGGTAAFGGLVIEGAGTDVTTIDTSAAGITSHDLATVSAITTGATTTGTLSAAVNWVDGSQVVISLPSYRRGIDSGSTIDLLNGQVVFVKATNRVAGTFTTFQLYCDAALTVPLISTGWGTFAAPARMRRYASDRTVEPSALLRITGPTSGWPDIYNIRVANLTFRNTTSQPISYDRQGVCVAIESERTDDDTIVAQNITFDHVRWEGYDCAVLLDDCTNTRFESCDFHGNNYYVWSAFNTDIVKFTNCMLGEDFPVTGQPLPQAIAPALSYFAPLNPTQDYNGSRNAFVFDNCWFMGTRITGGSQLRTYGGSQVYWTNGINPKPLVLEGCYFEQVSWLAEGQAIKVSGCHFGNFSRDANLTNGRAVFNLMTDNYDGARLTVEDCTGDAAVGAGPSIAYVSTANWGASGGQANEETTPTTIWRNNNLAAGAGNAHLIDFLDPTRKVLIGDGTASGDQVKGGGDYTFEGVLQTGGRTRIKRTATTFTGTVTPDVLAASRYWIGAMTGPVTIANPTVGGSTTFSSMFAASGTSAASFPMNNPLRQMPLEFIFEQDATGGRVVTFGTDFETGRLVLKGTAGQKTVIRFAWNGTKWIPMGPNLWTPGGVSPDPLIGTGNPEGQLNAPVGTLFLRTDGGTGSTLYVKETGTGSTGWVPMSAPGILVSFNQSGAYTLGSVDYGLGMDFTSATAVVLTVPTNATAGLPVGSLVRVTQAGAGQVTVTPAAGVTVRTPTGLSTRAQWSTIELRKRTTTEWVLSGDLSAT
jgi:hypothetical protein